MTVGRFGHHLFVNTSLSLVESIAELLKTRLNLVNRALKLLLLLGKLLNFLTSTVEFILLGVNELFGLIVLLFDLVKLDGDLADFFLLILGGRVVIVGLEKRVHVHSAFGTIINAKNRKESWTLKLK